MMILQYPTTHAKKKKFSIFVDEKSTQFARKRIYRRGTLLKNSSLEPLAIRYTIMFIRQLLSMIYCHFCHSYLLKKAKPPSCFIFHSFYKTQFFFFFIIYSPSYSPISGWRIYFPIILLEDIIQNRFHTIQADS